jgi:uncharacterized protein with HEPN domain
MPRDWRQRVQDMLDALENIQQYTEGMDYSAFQEDDKTFHAVLLNFQIIGEAASRLPVEFTSQSPQIPWADVRGLRNIIFINTSKRNPLRLRFA